MDEQKEKEERKQEAKDGTCSFICSCHWKKGRIENQ